MPFLMKSVLDTKQFEQCDTSRIASLISGKNLTNGDKKLHQSIFDTVLSIRQEKDKKKRDALKKKLPCLGFSNHAGEINSRGFVSTEYLMFDIDHLKNLTELNIVKNN
jgi:hypothetical protein